MKNQMLRYIDFYNQRIQFLRSDGDQLLDSIRMLEIQINRQKQRSERIYLYQNNWMYSMTKDLLKMLAEIKTCEYFKMTKQLVCLNDELYKVTFRAFFRDLVRQFNSKLNARKRKRLKRLNQIDFSIHH